VAVAPVMDSREGLPPPAAAPLPVFEVTALTKTYRMGEVEVQALRDVSLILPEREFVVLLGPSGSGKSTLLNILGGLDVPTSGTVRYRDLELTRADEAQLTRYRRRHVAAGMADRIVRLADGRIASVERRGGSKMAPRELSW
jgi:putative ABC transport system ATP-binding protein